MTELLVCQRCRQAILDARVTLRVLDRQAGTRGEEMTLCVSCYESFLRWSTRKQRHGHDLDDAPAARPPGRKESRHERKKREFSNHSEAVDYQIRRLRIWLLIIAPGIVLGFFIMIFGLYYLLK